MIAPAIFGAVISAYTAERSYVAALDPEKRAAYQARKAEERRKREALDEAAHINFVSAEIRGWIERERREALERLDATEEVRIAREWIVAEGLLGAYAEQLLAFARELAARRMKTRLVAEEKA